MDSFTGDKTQVPFHNKTADSKRKHRMAFKDEVSRLFDAHGLCKTDDCLDVLDYCKLKLGAKSGVVQAELALKQQLDSLALPERNVLIPLLTHLGDEMNEDMLSIFPSLEQRSQKLLTDAITKHKRKERDDKIDLKPISEFMHDYCR